MSLPISVSSRLLDEVPDEAWGQVVRRLRESAGFTVEGAAERISAVFPTSKSTLNRIETREDAPEQLRQRIAATLAVILYGVNPTVLGLDVEELPGLSASALGSLVRS